MVLITPSRADLHCHSSASELAKLGVQRALGLPECATDPEEAYALAKRRGMDFVTLTDHDTITGALALADRADTFVSEELTARFRGEPRAAVHILCYGITPDDHDALLICAGDIERVAAYLHAKEIACALAHPFYAVDVPLLPRHRRVLAELFAVWETRNGARARELNAPAAVYVETHGGTGVGGSDDHAGVTLGQTWTETPAAPTPAAFLTHLRTGRAEPGGAHGSAAKWTHAAVALAARVLGGEEEPTGVDPRAVLTLVQRILSEGDARGGALGSDLKPSDARALLRAWLVSVGLAASEDELLAHLQAPGFDHAELFRRARRVHERRLGVAMRGRRRRRGAPRPRRGRRRALRGLPAGRPLRAVDRLPGQREGAARPARGRAAARRARGRRHRSDARGDPHPRRDPRARSPRVRGRGHRDRPQRGPAPLRGP